MKIKITRNQIKERFGKIFYCGYCDLQGLLTSEEPRYYNSGLYGWNYDVYVFGGIAVTTGYRGMFGKRIDFNFLENLQKEAEENNKNMWTNKELYHKNKEAIEEKLISWLRNN